MELVLAYDRFEDILTLVREYIDKILEQGGDEVKKCLDVQQLDNELADIQKKYALPNGRLYLALVNGNAAGCVGLSRNNNDYCEIKRLYVRPEYRGQRIGRVLVKQIIDDAKILGYKHIRLDTFPFMKAAIRLYERFFTCFSHAADVKYGC